MTRYSSNLRGQLTGRSPGTTIVHLDTVTGTVAAEQASKAALYQLIETWSLPFDYYRKGSCLAI